MDLTLEDYAHLRTGEELALLGYDWSGRPEVSPASGGGVGEIARNLKNPMSGKDSHSTGRSVSRRSFNSRMASKPRPPF